MELFDSSWPFSVSVPYPSNHQTLAEANRCIVLGLICRRKCLSQKSLAARTKLQASTVSNIIRDLKQMGFVQDGSALKTTRVGPKEIILEIIPNFRWSVGIALDQQCRLVVINAGGHIIASKSFSPDYSMAKLVRELPAILEEFSGQWQLDWARFAGVGISVGGVVDPRSGLVMVSRALQKKSYPLGAEMEAALNVPVFVDRNVACGAYAEHFAGLARHVESFLHLMISSHPDRAYGYGLATVINEKIFRGNHSAAGEIDFLMEKIVSSGKLTGKSAGLTDAFYRNCGEGLAAVVNLLDIDYLVLSCDAPELTQERFSLVHSSMLKRLVPVPGREPKLLRSALQSDGPVLGAGLLALHRRMASDLIALKRETPLPSRLATRGMARASVTGEA